MKTYRIGKESEGKIRPIIARFEKPNDRQDVRRAAPVHWKGHFYGVNEHFPLKIRRDLLPIHKEARKRKLK